MTVSDEAVEAAARAAGLVFDEPANARDIEYMRTILEAAAPFIRAEALESAAHYIGDCIKAGADGDISADETRRWLIARAAEMRQG